MMKVISIFMFVNHVIMSVEIDLMKSVFHMLDTILVNIVHIIHLFSLKYTYLNFLFIPRIFEFMGEIFSHNAHLCESIHYEGVRVWVVWVGVRV